MYKNITLKVHLIYNLMYINIYQIMYIFRYITIYEMYITWYFQCTLNVHVLLNTMNVHCMYKNIPLKVHLIYNLMYINIYLSMYILRYITIYDMYIT